MSLASWYQYKADQCGHLARVATSPQVRAGHKETQKLWLQFAEIEKDSPPAEKPH
jgi:hypothetical protein